MSKELVIAANRHETRVALLEDDQLVEVYFQRANEYSLAGSIHKGRVTRVLPGMQSAFVDLGLERDTFLYVSDFLEETEDIDRVDERSRDERPRDDRPREERSRDDRPRDDRSREDRPDRRDDRGRDRRPQQQPPQPSAEPVQAAAPVASEEGAVAVESTQPAVAAPGEQRPQFGDDRRGRRSRRRRNRGRGIPDSKYAPEGGPQNAEPVNGGPAVDEPEEAEESPAVEVPIILPGESLAKYRSAPEPPVLKHVADEPAAPSIDEAVENEYDEPIHYPPENALPDAPVHREIVPAPPEQPAPADVRHMGALPLEALTVDSPSLEAPEEEEESEGGEAAAEGSGPAVAPMLDEEEDRDIQEMILSHAEGLDEEMEAALGEASEEGDGEEGGEESETEGGESASGAEGAPQGEVESGTAAVRERGGRFPHRVSRRMRRRGGRGGPQEQHRGPAQGRPERTDRPDRPERPQERTVARPVAGQISISDLLKEGQEIIVQIAKEPLGQKGARITSHIALPGRYVVYMPTLEHMGVSRKIGSDEERLRLKRILQGRRPGPVGGFITRTAAEGRTEEEIANDMAFLYNLWQDIKAKSEKRPAPALLHHDLDIVQRILRDQLADTFKAIWIDNEETYESVLRFVERFQPALVGKVKLYTRDAPIFDSFNVTSELEKALRPKVWLKSGGFIVINQTEALVAIDVNTGKYVGKTNRLEDTIVKTNTEAIKEIVRQIRLRDLGGIIVIDFIDMDERKNRQKVMQALEEAMRADRAPYKILQFNDFGLVAITRKRVKQSLERTLCSGCPYCEGAGYIKSVQTVVGEILTEARKMASSVEGKDVMLRVHPDVARVLKSHQNKYLEELEEVLRRPVLVKGDPQLHHEKFDLA
jgi:Rne/Rng family ribonuclease